MELSNKSRASNGDNENEISKIALAKMGSIEDSWELLPFLVF